MNTHSQVSKSSLSSSKAGSRSSDDELMLSSDELADVDIHHDATARPRTAGTERADTSDWRKAPPAASGGAARGGGLSFDPLSPMKEGNETQQSPGDSQVLSFFREDKDAGAKGGGDVDSLSSDLSDILGVSMKPSRLGMGRRRGAAAQEEQEKQEEEERKREEELRIERERERERARQKEEEEEEQRARVAQEKEKEKEREKARAQEKERQAAEAAAATAAAQQSAAQVSPGGGSGNWDDEVEDDVGKSSFAQGYVTVSLRCYCPSTTTTLLVVQVGA
jgi:hypothetical protein